jgi:glyoxylase-like metal-dependent hydrolase (beta-lactamase superfamily II)
VILLHIDTSIRTTVAGIHKLVIPTPFAVGPVNAYIVEGEAVTLFDIGPKTKEAWDSFTSQLKQEGFSLHDIDQVVLTHHHVDHCGLLDILLEKRDIPVLGHPLGMPWVEQNPEFLRWHREYFTEFYIKMGVEEELLTETDSYHRMLDRLSCRIRLSHTLKEGDRIPGMEEWKVYETPGHAQSHLVFHRESDGVLIGGDHIIKHISSNAILESPSRRGEERPKTLLQYRKSLLRCKQLDVTTVFSGHGDEVHDMQALIDRRIQEQEARAQKIRGWLVHEPLTPYQICQRMFPGVYRKELALTMSEVIGHLDLLIEQEQIIEEASGGLFRYKVV